MRTAVVLAVTFVLFIALVQWQRHYAERGLAKGLDAKVSVDRARRALATEATGATKSERSAATRALRSQGPLAQDAGSEKEEPSPNPEEPDDREARRKKAEAAMDAIQQLMNAERRDDDWAPAVEAWARTNYGKSPGSHLERIECRKTLCSVDGVHDSEQVYGDWVLRFTGHDRGLRVMTMPSVLSSGKTRARTFILKDVPGAR